MPLSLLILAANVALTAVGAVTGIGACVRLRDIDKRIQLAKDRQELVIQQFEKQKENTEESFRKIGRVELETAKDFHQFCQLFSSIREWEMVPSIDLSKFQAAAVSADALLQELNDDPYDLVGKIGAIGFSAVSQMKRSTLDLGLDTSITDETTASYTACGMGTGAFIVGASALNRVLPFGIGVWLGSQLFGMLTENAEKQADIVEANEKNNRPHIEERLQMMRKLQKEVERLCKMTYTIRIFLDEYIKRLSIHSSPTRTWDGWDTETRQKLMQAGIVADCLWKLIHIDFTERTDLNLSEISVPVIQSVLDQIKQIGVNETGDLYLRLLKLNLE